MKTIIIGMLLMSTVWVEAVELNVTVSDIEPERGGQIIVMIFEKNGFPKVHSKAISTQLRNVDNKEMTFSFPVSVEELAVKVLHDENKDGRVSKNWTGVYPKEGLGFSNKQKIGITGPPKYKKSRLIKEQFVNGINISLIYP